MSQKTFLNRLSTLAKLCGVVLDETMVAFYDRVLRDDYAGATRALEEIVCTRSTRDPFPSVADVKRLIAKEPADVDQAIEVSNRIFEAMKKFGPYRQEEANAFLGDIALYVVGKFGGLPHLCENMMAKDATMYRAQFRELALSAIRRYKLGQLNVAPTFKALPTTSGNAVKALVDTTAQRLKLGGTDGNHNH